METLNSYAYALGPIYDDTPKAVLAAVAVSLAIRLVGEDAHLNRAICEIVKEWERLHVSEIVPQAPRGPMTIICLAGWEGFRNPLTGRTV